MRTRLQTWIVKVKLQIIWRQKSRGGLSHEPFECFDEMRLIKIPLIQGDRQVSCIPADQQLLQDGVETGQLLEVFRRHAACLPKSPPEMTRRYFHFLSQLIQPRLVMMVKEIGDNILPYGSIFFVHIQLPQKE